MPEPEFRGWQYIELREPFGERRLDFLVGMLAALIANINRDAKHPGYKRSDFIPDWDAEPEPIDRTAMLEAEYLNLKNFLECYQRQREQKQLN